MKFESRIRLKNGMVCPVALARGKGKVIPGKNVGISRKPLRRSKLRDATSNAVRDAAPKRRMPPSLSEIVRK
jgi:hypothetical protein